MTLKGYDLREFDSWCRNVFPELPKFLAACESKNRAAAGKVLGIKGQSVGRSIHELENVLSGPLKNGPLVNPKEPRRAQPTDAGRICLKFCYSLLELRNQFLAEMTMLQNSSEIRVAITNYAYRTYGSQLEQAYRAIRPEGALNYGSGQYLQDHVWEEIETEVVNGRADVGIYSFPPSREKALPPELELMELVKEEFVLVLPMSLANKIRRATLTIYELSQHVDRLPRVVHYNAYLGFDRTQEIDEYLNRQRVMPRFEGDWLAGANTIEEIKATLREKGGISFLPWPAVRSEHDHNELRAYRLNPPMRPRTIRLVSRRDTYRPAIRDFLIAAGNLRVDGSFPG